MVGVAKWMEGNVRNLVQDDGLMNCAMNCDGWRRSILIYFSQTQDPRPRPLDLDPSTAYSPRPKYRARRASRFPHAVSLCGCLVAMFASPALQ